MQTRTVDWLQQILFSAILMLAWTQSHADTIEIRVIDGADDAEEHITNVDDPMGTIDRGSSDLELGEEGAGDLQEVGVRFQGVGIPSGSTINGAFIQFAVDETENVVDTSLRIFGELAADAAAYSSNLGDISSRTKTSNFVDWSDIPIWTMEHDAGPDQRTPDIASVVQEIINQPGWASGNAMAFMIVPNPGGERTAESFNGEPNLAPLLTVDFTPIPEPSAVFLLATALTIVLNIRPRRLIKC